jgi:tRNA pseudouridine(38-40) synthase
VIRRAIDAALLKREPYLVMVVRPDGVADGAMVVAAVYALLMIPWVLDGIGIITATRVILYGLVNWIILSGLVYLIGRYLLDGDGSYPGTMAATAIGHPVLLAGILLAPILDPWRALVAPLAGRHLRCRRRGVGAAQDPGGRRRGRGLGGLLRRVADLPVLMPVYRIDLAYDGTGFRGWARNAGVRTVQGEIEAALARVLGEEVSLGVAGRTDAGVHARHQVASFPSDAKIDTATTLRSLRTMLGPEIALRDLTAAPEGFDARFSAVRRSYRYFIDESPSHDPLRSHWVWHRGEALDLGAMNQAAAAFVGPHDFASLCRAAEGGTTERTVESAGWERSGGRHGHGQPDRRTVASGIGSRGSVCSSTWCPPRRSATRWCGPWWRSAWTWVGARCGPKRSRRSWTRRTATPPEESPHRTAWCCGRWIIEFGVESSIESSESKRPGSPYLAPELQTPNSKLQTWAQLARTPPFPLPCLPAPDCRGAFVRIRAPPTGNEIR